MGSTNLDVFAQTLMELAEHDRDLLIATSDSRGSGRVTPFAEKIPQTDCRDGNCRTESGGCFRRLGISRKKGVCRVPGLLPDGAGIRTNQE